MEPGGRGAWHEPGLPRWSRRAVLRCGTTRMPSTGHRRQTTDRGAKKTIVAPLFGKRRSCGRATTRSATQGSAMAPHGRPRPSWVCPPLLVAEGGPRCGSTSLLVEAPKGQRAGYLQNLATGRATPSGHRPHRPETLKTVSDGAHGTAVLVAFPPESDTCRACQQMVQARPWPVEPSRFVKRRQASRAVALVGRSVIPRILCALRAPAPRDGDRSGGPCGLRAQRSRVI
jgi:hypothetical protein